MGWINESGAVPSCLIHAQCRMVWISWWVGMFSNNRACWLTRTFCWWELSCRNSIFLLQECQQNRLDVRRAVQRSLNKYQRLARVVIYSTLHCDVRSWSHVPSANTLQKPLPRYKCHTQTITACIWQNLLTSLNSTECHCNFRANHSRCHWRRDWQYKCVSLNPAISKRFPTVYFAFYLNIQLPLLFFKFRNIFNTPKITLIR